MAYCLLYMCLSGPFIFGELYVKYQCLFDAWPFDLKRHMNMLSATNRQSNSQSFWEFVSHTIILGLTWINCKPGIVPTEFTIPTTSVWKHPPPGAPLPPSAAAPPAFAPGCWRPGHLAPGACSPPAPSAASPPQPLASLWPGGLPPRVLRTSALPPPSAFSAPR